MLQCYLFRQLQLPPSQTERSPCPAKPDISVTNNNEVQQYMQPDTAQDARNNSIPVLLPRLEVYYSLSKLVVC